KAQGGAPGMPPAGPPMPPPGAPMAGGMPPKPGMPGMKKGGRVKDSEAPSNEKNEGGRKFKDEPGSRPNLPLAKKMKAGAMSGEGRLEKANYYKKNGFKG